MRQVSDQIGSIMMVFLDTIAFLWMLGMAYTFMSWPFSIAVTSRIESLSHWSFFYSLAVACVSLGIYWVLACWYPNGLRGRVQTILTVTDGLVTVIILAFVWIVFSHTYADIDQRGQDQLVAHLDGSWAQITPQQFETLAKRNVRRHLATAAMPILIAMGAYIAVAKRSGN